MGLRSYIKRASYFVGVIFSLALVGCGGGGGGSDPRVTLRPYSGEVAPAAVDVNNAESMARAVFEATRYANNFNSVPGIQRSSDTTVPAQLVTITNNAKESLITALVTKYIALARIDETASCSFGGSQQIIFPGLNANATSVPQTGLGIFVFSDCDEFDFIFDGVLEFTWSGFDNVDIEFINFDIAYDLTITEPATLPVTTTVVNGAISCSDRGSFCSYTENFVGLDGLEYRVEDLSIQAGLSIFTRVFQETAGYVDFDAVLISYCSNGNIGGGTVTVFESGAINPIMDITFPNCNEYQVSFNGGPTVTYLQSAISTTTRATLTSDNSDEISQGAYEAARLAGGYGSAPGLQRSPSAQIKANDLVYDTQQKVTDLIKLRSSGALARIEEVLFCANGGTSTIIFPDIDANATVVPQTGRGQFIYNNCNELGTLSNGTIDFAWNGFDDVNGFVNFTVTFDLTITDIATGSVYTLTGASSCTNFGNNCSFSEDFVGTDGADYSVDDVVVTGDSLNGYDMTARVYIEPYGYVDIVATGITYCSTGNIATGTILVTDSTGTAVLDVSFTSCNDCIVTFGGVATIVPQP